ncbi:phage major capsid protein [Nocardioides sp.]|uniref:phage major capsid protein n=1 Tax=Nocardioides sp. TaxID=35761 RepID=UPI003783AC5C
MNLQELIAKKRGELPNAAERAGHVRAITQIRTQCDNEQRDPSPAEARRVESHSGAVRRIDKANAVELAEIEQLEAELIADREVDELAGQSRPTGTRAPSYDGVARVGANRDVYNAERSKRGERSYFADLFASEVRNDVGARQRVAAHHAEQMRAVSTAGFAGLVPPAYLLDQAALLARTGRPFADSVQKLPIPGQGMSLVVPRSTTGSSAAVQASENTAVSNTDEAWSNLTVPVVTIAGQAQVSRQSLERGAPGLDELVFADITGAYFAAQDVQCLSGTGSSGQALGLLNTSGIAQAAAFTAAATFATFYAKVNGIIASIAGARLMPADTIVMHPRRWAWLSNQVDSAGRPLVVPSTGVNAVTSDQAGGPAYGVTDATFLGLRVVVDPNVPINVGTGPEDVVIVYRAADLLLWQDGDGQPTDLRFEDAAGASLTVTLVAYGYSAFTAGRYPGAVGVVGGNAGSAGFGLGAPVF